ncbi:MAG: hypothetical protein AAF804_17650, partial [Bacteroidota bacterium]
QQTEELQTQSQAFEASLANLQEEQPVLIAYIFSENHEVFTENERELLLFLSLVIWRSVQEVQETPEITEGQLSTAEEANWELMTASKGDFRSKLDPFFADYPQEDLLALVEDALAEDEDSPITREGREALFVSLKTIIDVLSLS